MPRRTLRTTRCGWTFAYLVVALAAPACSGEHSTTAPAAQQTLAAADGDQQVGTPNETLSRPLAVRMLDGNGHPRITTLVRWSADNAGVVTPATSRTDSLGVARSTWTLGPGVGVQRAKAESDGYPTVTFNANVIAAPTPVDNNPILPLNLTTFDGSNQTVHPDYVETPAPWPGARHYLLLTPYPNGRATFENPSIYSGTDDVSWAAPAGVQNPIASPASGYLSDPDAVYLPDQNVLRVYYRAVDATNVIYMISSTDGVHFTAPVVVVQGPNNTIVSPTVVRRSATDWLMWSVNANVGCVATSTTVELRHSTDGLTWSAPTTVSLTQGSFYVWHIDVEWIPSRNEFWAVYNVKNGADCNTPALYLAASFDGVNWTTYPSPVLARGTVPQFADIVYRSSFAYDSVSDAIDFWYSGARYDGSQYVWSTAYQRRPRQGVFDAIAKPPSTGSANLNKRPSRSGVPPLLDAP